MEAIHPSRRLLLGRDTSKQVVSSARNQQGIEGFNPGWMHLPTGIQAGVHFREIPETFFHPWLPTTTSAI
jgi:hypothetical protein